MTHPPAHRPAGRPAVRPQRRATMRVAAMAFAVVVAIGMVTAVALGRDSSGNLPAGPGNGEQGLLAARASEQLPPVLPPTTVAPSPDSPPEGSTAAEESATDESGDAQEFTFPALADLKGRASPELDATVVKDIAYPMGTDVPVVCQVSGGEAFGSKLWDLTADGYYVTDSYVDTGHLGEVPNIPTCPGR